MFSKENTDESLGRPLPLNVRGSLFSFFRFLPGSKKKALDQVECFFEEGPLLWRAALPFLSGSSFLEGRDSATGVLQSSYRVADQVGTVGELGHHSTRLGHTGDGQCHNSSRQSHQVGGDSAYIQGLVIQLGVGIFESVGGAIDVRSEKSASHESDGHTAEPFGHVAGAVKKLRVKSIGCQTQSESGVVLGRLPAFIKNKHAAVFKELGRGRQKVAGFARRGVGGLLPLLLLLLLLLVHLREIHMFHFFLN